MHFIDGHNLIPYIPGLSLSQIDDELKLIDLLQTYSRVQRRQVRVYFDGAPPGQSGERAYGTVRAKFVPGSSTADEAIHHDLTALGKRARNITVVSSDRQVRTSARGLGAQVISSGDFAGELLAVVDNARQPARRAPPTREPPAGDLDEWLDLFGIDPSQADQPIESQPAPRQVSRRGGRKDRKQHGFPPKK